MKFLLSNASASAIAESLPAMEHNRQRLSARIDAYLVRVTARDADAGSDQAAGSAITEFLFEHARQFAADPSALSSRETKHRFRTLNVPKRSLAGFGDGLGAVMKDVLRAEATPAVLAAWGDAYWASVRGAADQERLLAA